jgi:hypothetical protein
MLIFKICKGEMYSGIQEKERNHHWSVHQRTSPWQKKPLGQKQQKIFTMSPCGAKIDCAEMISSESISCLFHRFSYWVPIIQERLRVILKNKYKPDQRFKNVHTGKEGEVLKHLMM